MLIVIYFSELISRNLLWKFNRIITVHLIYVFYMFRIHMSNKTNEVFYCRHTVFVGLLLCLIIDLGLLRKEGEGY